MTRLDVLDILNQSFPANAGFLLAGSQRNNIDFDNSADIDLIAVDASFSHVHGITLRQKGYKIDITILPFTDIDNLLLDEANNPRSGVLPMLSSGVPLKDNFGAFPLLKVKADKLLKQIGGKTFPLYKDKLNELGRYIKYFSKELNHQQRQFLACDVVAIIGELESIKSSNWLSHKQKLSLFDADPPNEICTELIAVFDQAIGRDSHQQLATFANYYWRIAETLPEYPILPNTRLLIDIDYPDFSLSHFLDQVLPAIQTDQTLGKSFGYFYLSPTRYQRTYRYRVTTVFDIANHTHASGIVQAIEDVFGAQLTKGVRYALVYQSNDQFENDSFNLLEELRLAINQFFIASFRSHGYTSVMAIEYAILFGGFLVNALRLRTEDIAKGSAFLAQQSAFTLEEQTQLNSIEQLKKQQNGKVQNALAFFQQYRDTIVNHCNKGVLLALQNTERSGGEYAGVLDSLDKIIQNRESGNETQFLLLALMQAKSEDPPKLTLYCSIMHTILQFLNMNDADKFICHLCLSKAVTELKSTN